MDWIQLYSSELPSDKAAAWHQRATAAFHFMERLVNAKEIRHESFKDAKFVILSNATQSILLSIHEERGSVLECRIYSQDEFEALSKKISNLCKLYDKMTYKAKWMARRNYGNITVLLNDFNN